MPSFSFLQTLNLLRDQINNVQLSLFHTFLGLLSLFHVICVMISYIQLISNFLYIGSFSESDQAVISKKVHALHIGSFQNTEQMFNGIPNLLDARIHHGESSQFIYIFSMEPLDLPELINHYDYR